jgi:hypothetical protein
VTAVSLSPVDFKAASSPRNFGAKARPDSGFQEELNSAFPSGRASESSSGSRDALQNAGKRDERKPTLREPEEARSRREEEPKSVEVPAAAVPAEAPKPELTGEIGLDCGECETEEEAPAAGSTPFLKEAGGAPGLDATPSPPQAPAVAPTLADTREPASPVQDTVQKTTASPAFVRLESPLEGGGPGPLSEPAPPETGELAFALRLKDAARAPDSESRNSEALKAKSQPVAAAVENDGRNSKEAKDAKEVEVKDAKEIEVKGAPQAAERSPKETPLGAAPRAASPSATEGLPQAAAPAGPVYHVDSARPPAAPARGAVEALRNAEGAAAKAPAAEPAPARDLSFRLERNQGTGSPVTVRFAERGGEVRVAVRSADETVAHTLRNGLDGLVRGLDGQGFQTERWFAPQSASSNPPGENGNGREGNLSRERDAGGRQGREQEGGRERESSGDREPGRPAWLEELERTRA